MSFLFDIISAMSNLLQNEDENEPITTDEADEPETQSNKDFEREVMQERQLSGPSDKFGRSESSRQSEDSDDPDNSAEDQPEQHEHAGDQVDRLNSREEAADTPQEANRVRTRAFNQVPQRTMLSSQRQSSMDKVTVITTGELVTEGHNVPQKTSSQSMRESQLAKDMNNLQIMNKHLTQQIQILMHERHNCDMRINQLTRQLDARESEVQRTMNQLVEKNKEIRELYSLLDAHASKKQEKKNEGHEKVHDEFYNHFDSIEFRLPRKVKNVDKQEFWRTCCELYQLSFFTCREAIHGVFRNTLINITELSKVEEESGEINLDRQEELESAKAAYQYLLKHSATELSKYNKDSLVEEVMSSLPSLPHDDKIKSILHEQAVKAVEICWKMQTVSPPMFLCQPKIYNDEWHLPHSKSWNDPPGELIYYRPVLMYSAGGTVAHKGFVGSKPRKPKNLLMPRQDSSEGEFKSLPAFSSDREALSPKVGANDDSSLPLQALCPCGGEILLEGLCKTCYFKTICNGCHKKLLNNDPVEYNGKYWHRICLPVKMTCSGCKNKVDSTESCKRGDHYYHKDCFTCAHCKKEIISDDSQASSDKSILWCNKCASKCYYCQRIFKESKNLFGRKLICQVCGALVETKRCFACRQSADNHNRVVTNCGVFHNHCICNCDVPKTRSKDGSICVQCRRLIATIEQ